MIVKMKPAAKEVGMQSVSQKLRLRGSNIISTLDLDHLTMLAPRIASHFTCLTQIEALQYADPSVVETCSGLKI